MGERSVDREGLVGSLIDSENPVVAYKARKLLAGEDPNSAEMIQLRGRIAKSEEARALLAHRGEDGKIHTNPYKKWQGPHWTLYSLALIDYPPGEASLLPLRDQVYDWLLEPGHMKYPRSLTIPGQEERVRRCASQEGNAVWYSIVLGLEDERTRLFVERLIDLQWPDGGWNCDKRPEARRSSIVETLIPLRALMLYGRAHNDKQAVKAGERAAEFLLSRRLLYRLRDGELIHLSWGGRIDEIHYPIQFYDVLFALTVMREIGRINDLRCRDALGVLAAKELPSSGFPLETSTSTRATRFVSRASFADWGAQDRRRANPYVTVEALANLRATRMGSGDDRQARVIGQSMTGGRDDAYAKEQS